MGFDGTADKFDQLATAYTNNNNNNNGNSGDSSESSESLPVLVASEDSARGLHLDGVDAVFVLARPRSAGMVKFTNTTNPRTHEPTNPPNPPNSPNPTHPTHPTQPTTLQTSTSISLGGPAGVVPRERPCRS